VISVISSFRVLMNLVRDYLALLRKNIIASDAVIAE
jgi:hypothetical protein